MPATRSLTGNAHATAQWFQQARQADEFEREDLQMDAEAFTEFATQGGQVLLRTPRGRTLVERREVAGGGAIIVFTHAPRGSWDLVAWWFNPHSVASLGDALRAAPDRRRDFDRLFIND